MRRIVQTVLASAVVAVTLAVGAGAAQTGGTRIDLSTDEAVAAYLASRGIDPATVVVQRGLKNYAGPSCPGAGWNCTTETRVVQVAANGGETRFECEPEGEPDPYPLVEGADVECFVVADAEGGNAHGRCVEKVTDSPEALLYCDMTLSGENTFAHVDQSVVQRRGSHQDAEVVARVTQNATSGNHLQLKQNVAQSTNELVSSVISSGAASLLPEGPAQQQLGRLRSEVQMNAGKTNVTHFFQNLDQRAGTGGAAVDDDLIREQSGDHFGDVDQTISSGDSANKFHAHQSERQTMTGGGRKDQLGGEFCCVSQVGGDPNQNELAIHQDKFQKCEEPRPEPETPTCEQHSEATGRYSTTGAGPVLSLLDDTSTGPSKFHILHHLANNIDRITVHESGPGVHTVHTQCHSEPVFEDLAASSIPAGCTSTAEGDDIVLDFLEHDVPDAEWP